MARMARRSAVAIVATNVHAGWTHPTVARARGAVVACAGLLLIAAFATYRATDPSLDAASGERARNLLGGLGAEAADLSLQTLGLAAWLLAGLMIGAGVIRALARDPGKGKSRLRWRVFCGVVGALALAGVLAAPSPPAAHTEINAVFFPRSSSSRSAWCKNSSSSPFGQAQSA